MSQQQLIFTEKSIKGGSSTWKYLSGVCSTDDLDLQGESISQANLDLSYLQKKGFANWNHSSHMLIGSIIKAEIKENKLWIKVRFFNTKFAQEMYELALEAQKAGKPLGWSIEGTNVERDVVDSSKITKTTITAVALTGSPVNPNTEAVFCKSIKLEKYSIEKSREIGDSIGVNWDEVDIGNFCKGMNSEEGDNDSDIANSVYGNLSKDCDYYSEKSINTVDSAALIPESLGRRKKEAIKTLESLHNSKKSAIFTAHKVENFFNVTNLKTADAGFVKKLKPIMANVQTEEIEKALEALGIPMEKTILKSTEEVEEMEKALGALDTPMEKTISKSTEPAIEVPADVSLDTEGEDLAALKKSVNDLTTIVSALVTKIDEPTIEKSLSLEAEVEVEVEVEAEAEVKVEDDIAKSIQVNEAVSKSISALTNSVSLAFDKLEQRLSQIENGGGVVKSVKTTGYVSKSFQDPASAKPLGLEKSLSNPSDRKDIIKSLESLSGINNVDAVNGGSVDESLMTDAMNLEMSKSASPSPRSVKFLLDHANINVVA
jgi:hypothetical protein